MKAREVRWERMFPDELEQAFAACPLVYFTYGLCEPHGPHNAMGLDALKAHAIACRAAAAFGGIVAPPDFWHIHESGGYASWGRRAVGEVPRKWLTAVPPWMHFKNICYHLRAAEAIGFHAIILLTGHYGPNYHDLKTLCELAQPFMAARIYSLPDFEANRPGFDRDGKSGGDHAGKVETSLLWELMPECVDTSRLPPPDAAEHPWAMGHDAYESNRREGARMVEDEAGYLHAKARELLAEYDRAQTQSRLQTFTDAEHLWQKVIRPALKNFRTMRQNGETGELPPEDSVWRANWEIPEEYS